MVCEWMWMGGGIFDPAFSPSVPRQRPPSTITKDGDLSEGWCYYVSTNSCGRCLEAQDMMREEPKAVPSSFPASGFDLIQFAFWMPFLPFVACCNRPCLCDAFSSYRPQTRNYEMWTSFRPTPRTGGRHQADVLSSRNHRSVAPT